MIDPPKRPWWRKKRWLAVALLWLVAWYPLSIGPYIYVKERGWFTGYKVGWLWDPVPVMFGVPVSVVFGRKPFNAEEAPLLWHCWSGYGQIWREAANRHREADQPDNHE